MQFHNYACVILQSLPREGKGVTEEKTTTAEVWFCTTLVSPAPSPRGNQHSNLAAAIYFSVVSFPKGLRGAGPVCRKMDLEIAGPLIPQ